MLAPPRWSVPLLAATLVAGLVGPVGPARAGEASAEGEAAPAERDLLDLVGLGRGSREAPREGELMFFVLPAVNVSPTVGLALGAAASAAIALGPPSHTIVSSMSASVMATTKKQLMSSVKTVLVTSGNTWELLGDLRYYVFAEPTYGLSTGDVPASGGFVLNGMDTQALPGGQPMTFQYLKVHEVVFRRLKGPAYLGVGYHLDAHSHIEDQALDTGATPPAITSHYLYSKVEGFDPAHYRLSGVSLDALWESRDHTLDPYSGRFLQLGYRINPTWLGSTRASSSIYGELRTYHPLSADRPRHLIAAWVMVDAVVTGRVPYLDLPAVGYDTRGRSGRAYPAGRFRGTALVYGEVEYRFPITRDGLLGGVAFVNATTAARPALDEPSLGVSEPGVSLFQAVKPAGGLGLRIRADRQARMNVVVDVALGAGGASGLYLSMGETF